MFFYFWLFNVTFKFIKVTKLVLLSILAKIFFNFKIFSSCSFCYRYFYWIILNPSSSRTIFLLVKSTFILLTVFFFMFKIILFEPSMRVLHNEIHLLFRDSSQALTLGFRKPSSEGRYIGKTTTTEDSECKFFILVVFFKAESDKNVFGSTISSVSMPRAFNSRYYSIESWGLLWVKPILIFSGSQKINVKIFCFHS